MNVVSTGRECGGVRGGGGWWGKERFSLYCLVRLEMRSVESRRLWINAAVSEMYAAMISSHDCLSKRLATPHQSTRSLHNRPTVLW